MPLGSWISNIFFFGGRKILSIFDSKVLTDVIFISEGSKLFQILMVGRNLFIKSHDVNINSVLVEVSTET